MILKNFTIFNVKIRKLFAILVTISDFFCFKNEESIHQNDFQNERKNQGVFISLVKDSQAN